MILTRDEILAQNGLPREPLFIPEWDGNVIVRAMTAGERDGFEMAIGAAREEGENPCARARIAVITLVDDAGRQLFTEADIPALSAKYAKPIDRIFDVAIRLSKLTKDDVEALEKN
jgi:hypothetical protein